MHSLFNQNKDIHQLPNQNKATTVTPTKQTNLCEKTNVMIHFKNLFISISEITK